MTHATKRERTLDDIYAEIPSIPDCDGWCAVSCGPIAMFKGEFARVTRSFGRKPRMRPGSITCPMLSPTGRCKVYSVRPLICRLWGATKTLGCPHGCVPERWLSVEESHEIFERVRVAAGPEIDGPLGNQIEDLWEGIGLVRRQDRTNLIEAAVARRRNEGL